MSGANLALDLDKFSPEDARAKPQQDKLAQTETALDAHALLQGFLLLPSYPRSLKNINKYVHTFHWPLGFFLQGLQEGRDR